MAFQLSKFFQDIFSPARGEVVTVMYDVPHGDIHDNDLWRQRREMADDWHAQLLELAPRWGARVAPIVTYRATGSNNADLPSECLVGGAPDNLPDLVRRSTILLAMTEFSATAPLYGMARASDRLRVGSMPGVARFMEESGLSADYKAIEAKCKVLVDIFDRGVAADVAFSTGHTCHFDLPGKADPDDGILHPEKAGTEACLSNLPAGEVYTVPDERAGSATHGELPFFVDGELAICVVDHNRIVEVKGKWEAIAELRRKFVADPAWGNIAEFAIGLNDKARVTGIVLEDEKAGFHWAYGRSDHLGGTVGVEAFTSPSNVVHQDIVYAAGSPIVCKKLEMIFTDGSRQVLIRDGELLIDG